MGQWSDEVALSDASETILVQELNPAVPGLFSISFAGTVSTGQLIAHETSAGARPARPGTREKERGQDEGLISSAHHLWVLSNPKQRFDLAS